MLFVTAFSSSTTQNRRWDELGGGQRLPKHAASCLLSFLTTATEEHLFLRLHNRNKTLSKLNMKTVATSVAEAVLASVDAHSIQGRVEI